MKFDEFPLHADIIRGINQAAFTDCTKVQQAVIRETIINDRDVTVQSQTGTGKTAAFLIPIFHLLMSDERYKNSKALIIAPTRELAVQIEEEAQILGSFLPLKSACFYGGVGYAQQEDALKAGVDLVIGTPGRLMDFIQSKKINPRDFGILVIDEADRLLDMGFYPDIKKLLGKCRDRLERRTMLLSATLSTRVSTIAWEHMNDPVTIVIEAETIAVEAINQIIYHVSASEKMSLLLGILRERKPSNALVFCNTKRMAEEVSKRLEINGYPSHFIMGDLAQKKRLSIINDMKQGRVNFLVATDVAARGLHIDALDLVVNFDIPEDCENYVHRIGRTARAGKTGTAITLACEHFVFALDGIEKYLNIKIPVGELTEISFGVDASKGQRIRLDNYDDTRSAGHAGRPDKRGDQQGRRRPDALGPVRSQPHQARPVATRPAASPHDRPIHPRAPEAKPVRSNQAAVAKGRSVEERLEFYRQKYGESFKPNKELLEKLKREEQRALEHRPRSARPANKPHSQGPRPEAQKQFQKTEQASADKTVAQEQTAHAKPANKGGLLNWVKALFRGNRAGQDRS